MLYITFNDAPSGIYLGQVTDVCNYLEKRLPVKIRLIAFVSIRTFLKDRRAIRLEFSRAIVVPMFPTMSLWRLNLFTLFFLQLFRSEKISISRGPYATWLALCIKKTGLIQKVCFDARGAYDAELHEYGVVKNKRIVRGIKSLEGEVLRRADFRLAVSNSLVTYWQQNYGYKDNRHVVIPCTLYSGFLEPLPFKESSLIVKQELGVAQEDILLSYSGSSSGWQSFEMVKKFLAVQLKKNPLLKIIFLSSALPEGLNEEPFKGRLIQKWVRPSEVKRILSVCDYGLIIREKSVTNKVSSPVKFAEYLSCGLQILISPEIGDYSDFVLRNDCGQLVSDVRHELDLSKIGYNRKVEYRELAIRYFSKETYLESYKKIFE
ncbi:MAG TPA: hypothetical protein VK808_10865 [Bacteroidia bacterium]|jgi:hypothetical protein|nr:hypothetical protein [Bacteroidia bacterium]